jgi:hypothetical protein
MATPFDTAPGPSPCDYTPFDDDANYSKFSLIVKPAQSGKTGKMLTLIRESETRAEEMGTTKDLNFIFHGYTKTLGRQTSARLSDTFSMGNVLIWNSDGEVHEVEEIENTNKSAEEVLLHCLLKHKKYVLCCSHPTRFTHFMKLLSAATSLAELGTPIPKINIFIDEADQSMGIWSPHKDEIDDLDVVKNVFLVTATPEVIIKELEEGVRVELDEQPIIPGKYVGIEGQDFVINDMRANPNDYITKVFDLNRLDEKLVAGSRWFVPSGIDKISHCLTRSFFLNKGCNVVLVNGEDKSISFADHRPQINLTEQILHSGEELGAILKRYWLDESYGMQTAPLIITGNLCIERGITFQDSREGAFLFDYAIIADIDDAAKAYQVMARMFGNFDHVRGEHRGTIYTTSSMKAAIERQELIAMRLSEVARVKGTIRYEDLMEHFPRAYTRRAERVGVSESDKMVKVFATQDEARYFICNVLALVSSLVQKRVNWRSEIAQTEVRVAQPDGTYRNPTVEELKRRFYGLSDRNVVRMYPTADKTWCVYWKYSMVPYDPTITGGSTKLRVKRSA